MSLFKNIKTLSVCFTVILGLEGCVSLLPAPAPAPKLVSFSIPKSAHNLHSSKSLTIDEPTTSILYDSQRIILQKRDTSGLVNYAVAQDLEWTERLPKLLQRSLASYLKSPSFPAIHSETKTFPSDYKLLTDIEKFHIQSPGAVEVALNMTLVDVNHNSVVATKSFSYTLPSEHSTYAYISAFEKSIERWGEDSAQFLQSHLK